MIDTELKPETLKKIAELLGYRIKPINPEWPYVYIEPENSRPNNDELLPFSPLTNNDQLVECIEKLKLDVKWFEDTCVIFDKAGDMLSEGKTLAEAACNAMAAIADESK